MAQLWIGRDAFTGEAVQCPTIGAVSGEDLRAWSAFPRQYGFHGTLRAPCRLASGVSEDDAVAALHRVSRMFAPFEAGTLEPTTLGDFLALVPRGANAQLSALAEACVRETQALRAELTAAEWQKRKPDALSEKQRGYLKQWGYPYIFDEFRFHLTLTKALPDLDERSRALEAAQSHFAAHIGRPLAVDGIALFVQPEGEDFRIHTYAPLSGSA
ncbi:MAG: DUF1045 domain-containing protein [Pseudomonadota bacterium]